jgi:type IV secretion system protein VirB8
MAFLDEIKKIKKKINVGPPRDALEVTRNWFTDRYENLQVQRSMLFMVLVVFSATIVMLTASITYIKSTRTIEPFVIEIEQKTGVPTVVDPVTAIIYSGQESVKRYFIWEYIKLREEFLPGYFDYAQQKLSVMSAGDVYSQYRSIIRSPDGPVAKLGKTGTMTVQLKSLVFINDTTAQVRFRLASSIALNELNSPDKIVYLEFEFANVELNEDLRYLNPLGFRVTKYRLEDEKV